MSACVSVMEHSTIVEGQKAWNSTHHGRYVFREKYFYTIHIHIHVHLHVHIHIQIHVHIHLRERVCLCFFCCVVPSVVRWGVVWCEWREGR